MKEISYLSWIDKGSSRKFIIAKNDKKICWSARNVPKFK